MHAIMALGNKSTKHAIKNSITIVVVVIGHSRFGHLGVLWRRKMSGFFFFKTGLTIIIISTTTALFNGDFLFIDSSISALVKFFFLKKKVNLYFTNYKRF